MDSLIDLFSGHTTKKTFKTSKVSITLRTLTADEIADVFKRVDLQAISDVTKAIVARKYTVAYALEKINGIDVLAIPEIQKIINNEETRVSKVDAVAEILGKLDDSVLRSMYTAYEQLAEEQDKSVEELKKD